MFQIGSYGIIKQMNKAELNTFKHKRCLRKAFFSVYWRLGNTWIEKSWEPLFSFIFIVEARLSQNTLHWSCSGCGLCF